MAGDFESLKLSVVTEERLSRMKQRIDRAEGEREFSIFGFNGMVQLLAGIDAEMVCVFSEQLVFDKVCSRNLI